MWSCITCPDASNIWIGLKLVVIDAPDDPVWSLDGSIYHTTVQRLAMKSLAVGFLMEAD
jgi:hypothetical protein